MEQEILFVKKEMADELRRLRATSKLSRKNVAIKASVDEGTVIRYENGTWATLDKLMRILKVYNSNLFIFFKTIYTNMYK